MVSAVAAAQRIITRETTYDGISLSYPVEYSSTIMKHFSQKKERREKFLSIDPRNELLEDIPCSELKRVYLNLDQIKQDVKVPRPHHIIQDQNVRPKIRNESEQILTKGLKGINSSLVFKPQTGSRAEHSSKAHHSFISPAITVETNRHIEIIPDITLSLIKSSSEQPIFKQSQPPGQNLVFARVVRASYQTSAQQDEGGENSSLQLHSENDSSVPLEDHLHSLADSLTLLCKEPNHPRKETIFRQILIFVTNLKRFELDSDLVIRMKIGRFLSVIYNLLLRLSECKCEYYSLLLVETSSLISSIKCKVLLMVTPRNPVLFSQQRRVRRVRDQGQRLREVERRSLHGRKDQLFDAKQEHRRHLDDPQDSGQCQRLRLHREHGFPVQGGFCGKQSLERIPAHFHLPPRSEH